MTTFFDPIDLVAVNIDRLMVALVLFYSRLIFFFFIFSFFFFIVLSVTF